MSTERDPRTDPRPGDVMRKGKETREVVRMQTRNDGVVWRLVTRCTATDRNWQWDGYPIMDQWRRWAKGAEVVKNADL